MHEMSGEVSKEAIATAASLLKKLQVQVTHPFSCINGHVAVSEPGFSLCREPSAWTKKSNLL